MTVTQSWEACSISEAVGEWVLEEEDMVSMGMFEWSELTSVEESEEELV